MEEGRIVAMDSSGQTNQYDKELAVGIATIKKDEVQGVFFVDLLRRLEQETPRRFVVVEKGDAAVIVDIVGDGEPLAPFSENFTRTIGTFVSNHAAMLHGITFFTLQESRA